MTRKQPADDKSDAIEFEKINHEIDLLLKRLRGFCPCCVAQGMMWRGSFLHAEVAGPEETVALCLEIADSIEQSDDARETQH